MDINLIKESYKKLPSEKLIRTALKEKQQLSEEAVKVLEAELKFRDIDIKSIAQLLAMENEELINFSIDEKSTPLSTHTQNYLEKELNNRFATELSHYTKHYSSQQLINIIKNHRSGVEIINPLYIKIIIYILRNTQLTPSLAEEFKMFLSADLEFFLKKPAEVSPLLKINEAGKAIRKIGVYLTRYLLCHIGIVLNFIVGGSVSLTFYLIYGIATLILVILVIAQFYNAGNALLSITKDQFNEKNK
jgi:hypothetical protein